MFGSNVFFVLSGHGEVSSVRIFGEGNDGEANLLRVPSHEDLTNLHSVLQCNRTQEESNEVQL